MPLYDYESNQYLVKKLMDINAISLAPTDPFVWSSGIVSPLYCDNRLILGYPILRRFVVDLFVDNIQKRYPQCELIAATSTSGIPYGSLISEKLDLPLVYVRNASKSHGKNKQIEGGNCFGFQTVVIEDLISTAKSVCNVVTALKKAGALILGVEAIFDYQLPLSKYNLQRTQTECHSLSDYHLLIHLLKTEKLLPQSSIAELINWHQALSISQEKSIRQQIKMV